LPASAGRLAAGSGLCSTIYPVSYCGAAVPGLVAGHVARPADLFNVAQGYAACGAARIAERDRSVMAVRADPHATLNLSGSVSRRLRRADAIAAGAPPVATFSPFTGSIWKVARLEVSARKTRQYPRQDPMNDGSRVAIVRAMAADSITVVRSTPQAWFEVGVATLLP